MLQTISIVISIMGMLMLFPAMADISAGSDDWQIFAFSALSTFFVGVISFAATWRNNLELSHKNIFIFVPLIWLVACVVCAVPLYLSKLGLTFTDAFFEATSGLTTTGSTVLIGLDTMAPGILLWRSLTQWIGGLGFVVMGMALLPTMRSGGQQLFKLESSDKNEKPFAHTRVYAERILMVYLVLTVSCAMAYFVLGMSGFEAINHAMTTVSTGGFSTSDRSMGAFGTNAMLATSTFFMFVGGLPFLFMIHLGGGRLQKDVQIGFYISLILIASLAIYLSMVSVEGAFLHRIVVVVFNVVSVITTTGFASENYLLWGPAALTLFFFLTFIGGCSGSTAGGFKIFRLVIVRQLLVDNLYRAFRPHQLRKLKYGSRVLPPEVADSVMIFSFLYSGTFIAFATIYGTLGLDFETAISASATALANVGPGIGSVIGPDGNFSTLSDQIKLMLCFEMIVGRLELVSVYVLLLPGFWE